MRSRGLSTAGRSESIRPGSGTGKKSRTNSFLRRRRSSVAPTLTTYQFGTDGKVAAIKEKKVPKKPAAKDTTIDEPTLVEQWETMALNKGIHRRHIIVGLMLVVFLLLVIFFVALGHVSGTFEFAGDDDALDKQEKTTTISLDLDENGELTTETVTEITGYDNEGHFCATKETKEGTLAQMAGAGTIKDLDNKMGHQLGSIIDQMTGNKDMSDKLGLEHTAGKRLVDGEKYETDVDGMKVEIERV